jgi:uncharacterized membrane protein YccF (DUF307 family)
MADFKKSAFFIYLYHPNHKGTIMNILMNILWMLLGGIITSISYLFSSLALMITIIGIPFGLQTLKLSWLALCPFGKEVHSTPQAGGCLNIIMNIIWLLCGGIETCLAHLIFGLFLCITIIGIPFGRQHFKMAAIALTPFGKQIVEK